MARSAIQPVEIRAGDLPFFPGFFLAGAPRCGTTSISKYLARHPEICFSRPKELFYFHQVTDESLARIREDYLQRYFSHCDPQRHRVLGEGSVHYLYDREAIRRILSIQPGARFIVAVRNPIDMLRSYHYRLLYLLEEDQEDFLTAWDLQQERAQGRHVPKRCTDVRALLYREIASFGKHIERLQELAGTEQCHVVVNEDLKEHPQEVYRDLFRFVGVSDDIAAISGETEVGNFPRRLRSKTYRWRWLQVLLYKRPTKARGAVERSRVRHRSRPAALSRLRKRLLRFNRIKQDPPAFTPETRALLRETLDADIRKLGQLLGRNFDHWV